MPLNHDHTDDTTKVGPGDMSLAKTPNPSPPFVTNDESGETSSALQVDHNSQGATAGKYSRFT